MAKKNIKDISENLVSELLERLNIKAEVSCEMEKADEETVCSININPDSEAGLLIGAHGTTLNAIQSFVSLSLKQQTGEWVRVTVDVESWREKHDAQLEELAEQAAMRARETGEPQHLYNLSPAQRRIVHMALTKSDDIETLSEGEGLGRYLVVKTNK